MLVRKITAVSTWQCFKRKWESVIRERKRIVLIMTEIFELKNFFVQPKKHDQRFTNHAMCHDRQNRIAQICKTKHEIQYPEHYQLKLQHRNV